MEIKEIVSLTKKLIEFESIESKPDQLQAVIDFVEDYLRKNTKLTLYRYESSGKPSLVGIFSSKLKKESPSSKETPYQTSEIIFHDHLDVVPGKPEQFASRIKGNKLYGRGAADTKTHGAVLMVLAKELSQSLVSGHQSLPHVGFMFTTDEEVSGHNGSRYLLRKGYRCQFFVTLEPTNFDILPSHKGVLWLKVRVKGKSAHASRPWEGVNAALKAYRGLQKLYEFYPLLKGKKWQTTINLGGISGGDAFNKVMGECELKLDFRHIEKDRPDAIVKNIKKCFPGSVVEVVEKEVGMTTDFKDPFVQKLAKVVKEVIGRPPLVRRGHGACDGRFYSAAGIPAVEFGTVSGGLHTDSEWVDLRFLERFYKVLLKLVQKMT